MSIRPPERLTEREYQELAYAREQSDKNREHELELKRLELKIAKLNASWNQVWRLPLALIFLPVKFVLSFGILIAFAFGRDFPDALWDLLKYQGQ